MPYLIYRIACRCPDPAVPKGSKYRGRIFSAWSADGLDFTIDSDTVANTQQEQQQPLVIIDCTGEWDAAKASEPSVIELQDGRLQMFWEACDMAGHWRIASATGY